MQCEENKNDFQFDLLLFIPIYSIIVCLEHCEIMNLARKIEQWISFQIGMKKYGQISAIFNLNPDSFNELFDHLSLRDLNSLAHTCKCLHQVIGEYFTKNFAAINVIYGMNGLITSDSIRVAAFIRFIQKLSMHRDDMNSFRYIITNCESLKEIHFVSITLTDFKMECMKAILSQVEIIKMSDVTIDGNFYVEFLQFCTNLKQLSVRNCKSFDFDWMLKTYPKLQHFELIDYQNAKFNDLLTFFKANPHIQSFSTDSKFISRFNELIEKLAVNLNDLTIVRGYRDDLLNDSIFHQLIMLYNLGFYKKLHLHGAYRSLDGRILQNHIEKISQLKLETIHFRTLVYVTPNINLLSMIHLKEVKMHDPQMCTNIQNMARKLLHLERISFTNSFLDDVAPFVKYSTNLKEIHLFGNIRSEWNVIHLSHLNEERMKLTNACKVTIHANDEIYIATKWTNRMTVFDLVELKRS